MNKTDSEFKKKIAFIITAAIIMITLVITAVNHIRWFSLMTIGIMMIFGGFFFKKQTDNILYTVYIIASGFLIIVFTLMTVLIPTFTNITAHQIKHLCAGIVIMLFSVPIIVNIIQIIRMKQHCNIKKQVKCVTYNMKYRKKKLYKQPIYRDEQKNYYTRDNFSNMFNPKEGTESTIYISKNNQVFDVKYNISMFVIYLMTCAGIILIGIKYIIVNV